MKPSGALVALPQGQRALAVPHLPHLAVAVPHLAVAVPQRQGALAERALATLPPGQGALAAKGELEISCYVA